MLALNGQYFYLFIFLCVSLTSNERNERPRGNGELFIAVITGTNLSCGCSAP